LTFILKNNIIKLIFIFGEMAELAARPRRVRLGRKGDLIQTCILVLYLYIMYYYIYIIKSSQNNKLYKGFTTNLQQRLSYHNAGKVKSTTNDRPWKLIYYEVFLNKQQALREEIFLKSGKGRERIKFLFKDK
jgi:putative endonuclease